MNNAWHRRRAKREIRRGGKLGTMPHLLQLRYSVADWLLYSYGLKIVIVKKDADE